MDEKIKAHLKLLNRYYQLLLDIQKISELRFLVKAVS
jgi:hypothetical protein